MADDKPRQRLYRATVAAFRRLLAQRHLASWLCAATLLLKLLVPAGYMIGSDHGRIAITLCSGLVSHGTAMTMPATHGHMPDHGPGDHDKAEKPCAFAGLSAAMTGAIDPIQLAALLAFVMAIGRVATPQPEPAQPAHLRPPLRGPPARL